MPKKFTSEIERFEGKGISHFTEDRGVQPVVDLSDGKGDRQAEFPLGVAEPKLRVQGPEMGHRVVIEIVNRIVEGIQGGVGGFIVRPDLFPDHDEGHLKGFRVFRRLLEELSHPLHLCRGNAEGLPLQGSRKGIHGLSGLRGEVHPLLAVGLVDLLEFTQEFFLLSPFPLGGLGILNGFHPPIEPPGDVLPEKPHSPLPRRTDRPLEGRHIRRSAQEGGAAPQNPLEPLRRREPLVARQLRDGLGPGGKGRIGRWAGLKGGAPFDELGDLDEFFMIGEGRSKGIGVQMAQKLEAHGRLKPVPHSFGGLVHQAGELILPSGLDLHIVFQIREDKGPGQGVGDGDIFHRAIFERNLLQKASSEGVHLRPVRRGLGDVHIGGGPSLGGGVSFEIRHIHTEDISYFLIVEVPQLHGIFDHGGDDGKIDVPFKSEVSVIFRSPAPHVHLDEIGEIRMGLCVADDGPVEGGLHIAAPDVEEGPLRPSEGFVPFSQGIAHAGQGRPPRLLRQFGGLFVDVIPLEGGEIRKGQAVRAQGVVEGQGVEAPRPHVSEAFGKGIVLGLLQGGRLPDGVDLQPGLFLRRGSRGRKR